MLNNFFCYVHRPDDIPTVIENDPFLIEHLDDRDAIQRAYADVASRLAANRSRGERNMPVLYSSPFSRMETSFILNE
jgi:hypothetical protein